MPETDGPPFTPLQNLPLGLWIKPDKFYGDESGNSGGGFFDLEQPIFVLALVGWDADRELEILQEYERICVIHGRTPPSEWQAEGTTPAKGNKAKEAKSEKLLDYSSGKQFCIALMDMILKLNISCIFGVSEKRFLVTAMLVESFLDPVRNTSAPPQSNRKLRQKIAREIYNLFDEALLKAFSEATKDDDVQALEQIGMRIAERLRLHADPEISHSATAIQHGALRAFRFGEKQADTPKRANRPHAGIHTLFATILTLEQNLITEDSTAQLVVDEEGSWDDVKKYAFNTHTSSDAFLDEIGFGSLERVRSLDFKNSKSHFALQMADILAGILMRGCRNHLKGEKDFLGESVYKKIGSIFCLVEERSFVAVENRDRILGWVMASAR